MENVRRYHLITLFLNLSFTLPIWVIFGTDYLQLSHIQAYWLGTFSWLVSTVFEIPTGSWADHFGRKKIYSVGILVGISALLLYVLTKNFYLLLISQIVAGFAVALKSGPLSALIYDWLKSVGREKEYLDITSNNHTYLYIGRVLGGALGGFAYAFSPKFPYILLATSQLIAWWLVQGLEETRHLSPEPLSDKKLIKEGIVLFKRLMGKFDFAIVMYASIAFSCLANILWYAYQPYFQKLGFSEGIIGLIYIPISITSALGTELIKKIMPKVNAAWLYVIMLLITAIVALGLNSFSLVIGIVSVITLSIIFGFDTPATTTFFQPYYPSKIRATMSSIDSMIGSLVLVTASIVTGIFLDKYPINVLFITIASITFLTCLGFGVFSYLGRKTKTSLAKSS